MSFLFELELVGRIVLSAFCGALIGFERESRRKDAGIKTHIIVAAATALMMILSKYAFFDLFESPMFAGIDIKLDPSRVAQGIISGIGFLGAGSIFVRNKTVTGLTTAASIWATTGIGMALGAGLYFIGGVSTVFLIIIQFIMHKNIKFLHAPAPKKVTFLVTDADAAISEINELFSGKAILRSMEKLDDSIKLSFRTNELDQVKLAELVSKSSCIKSFEISITQ